MLCFSVHPSFGDPRVVWSLPTVKLPQQTPAFCLGGGRKDKAEHSLLVPLPETREICREACFSAGSEFLLAELIDLFAIKEVAQFEAREAPQWVKVLTAQAEQPELNNRDLWEGRKGELTLWSCLLITTHRECLTHTQKKVNQKRVPTSWFNFDLT